MTNDNPLSSKAIMLALRDQENLVHLHQTAAAGKSLNQGVRQLQPKTPSTRAPKTPFKVPLNDENGPLGFGNKTGKGRGIPGVRNEDAVKPGKDSFITPMGTRNRAPLGMKTTNAKATSFQTPGANGSVMKSLKANRRNSTAQKIRKTRLTPQENQIDTMDKVADEDDIPEIEYMPPKPQDLPDDPDGITYNTNFPQFQGRNLIRGWEQIYLHGRVGTDGLTQRERKLREDSIAYDKLVDQMIQKQVDEIPLIGSNLHGDSDEPYCIETKRAHQEEKLGKVNTLKVARSRTVSTIKSRDAASALSASAKSVILPLHREKSVNLTGKKPSTLLASKKTVVPAPTNPSTMRYAAATASSRTTVGYSKGRTVSSLLPSKSAQPSLKKSSMSIMSPERYMELYGAPPMGSEMWECCQAAGLLDTLLDDITPVYEEDEEICNFELTL